MKKIIILLLAINVGLVIFLAGMLYLAEVHPFHSTSALFHIQSAAENTRVNLTSDPVKKAEESLSLVEYRLADLGFVDRESKIDTAVSALDKALTTAILNVEEVPAVQSKDLFKQVENLLVRIEVVISGVEVQLPEESLTQLGKKVVALQEAITPKLAANQVSTGAVTVPAVAVAKVIPFLGQEIEHEFSLAGGHSDLDCMNCHADGIYADKSDVCTDCHGYSDELFTLLLTDYPRYELKKGTYPDHFEGECSQCHDIMDWEPFLFNHVGILECKSCHNDDTPMTEVEETQRFMQLIAAQMISPQEPVRAAHYYGDCSNCHSDTENWVAGDFDHEESTCQSCHDEDWTLFKPDLIQTCMRDVTCESCHTPTGHDYNYQGACTNCHEDTEDWKVLKVNHNQFSDCNSCHTWDLPSRTHYKGLCSDCHSTISWTDTSTGHVGGRSCTDCHNPPEIHYEGDCRDCHRYTSWNFSFLDHSLGTCTNCHDDPVGTHYPNTDCKECHNPLSWTNIDFEHSITMDCVACHNVSAPLDHYEGQCSKCHSTVTWTYITFNHEGLTDCNECHLAPAQHYPGTCSLCHITSNWMSISYTHIEYSACSTCHVLTAAHWPGECYKCHNTTSWSDYSFDHTGYTDCKACHPRPDGHPRGQCSGCHTTDTWYVAPTSTPLPTATPIPTQTPLPIIPTNTPVPVIPSDTPVP